MSSYNNSPFFEFFRDELWEIYDHRYEFLLDFNSAVLEFVLRKLKIPGTKPVTESLNTGIPNFQNLSDTSTFDPVNHSQQNFSEYRQVFQYKSGFVKNLSILDMLSCTGKLLSD